MLYVAIKIHFKKFLDFEITIFGFCRHKGHFKKNVGMTTLPNRRVMSSLPYIQAPYITDVYENFNVLAKVVNLERFEKNSTHPFEAVESWNGSLAQFLDEQVKQK
jgi:hypothetical protein